MRGVKLVSESIGKKYGRLTVLEYIGSDEKYRSIVKARCECGNIRNVRLSLLLYGSTTSCGCYNREVVKKAATTHANSKTPMYKVWYGIKARCFNKNSTVYHHYGGRGITMYERWAYNFTEFRYWCIKHGWQKGLHIDRIDNNKGYYPDNCRIVSAAVNSRNKRSNINITINGRTMIVQDWCKEYKINRNTFLGRIKKGVPPEIAILKNHKLKNHEI